MRLKHIFLLSVGCAACGGGSQTITPPHDEMQDDFASPPAAPASALVMSLEEQTIASGAERIICHYFEATSEELLLTAFGGYQGQYGHHLALFQSSAPERPGTIRDCSEAADMLTLIPILADVDLEPGLAVRVPAGTQLVLQSHYINSSTHEIRVRDIAHLVRAEASEVQRFVGFLGLSDLWIAIPPTNTDFAMSFDCEVPFDVEVLTLGAHMHEWGRRFAIDVVHADGAQERQLAIEEWTASMRDHPPQLQFGLARPLQLRAGDRIRTECVFKNDTAEPLEFPKEMCATFGFYLVPEGSSEAGFLCAAPTNEGN